uniref:Ataxin 7 like 1 n=1 Tax=Sus scrofa TaxID=9823 RepID=A0A8D1AM42_PIG
MTSERSRIPCLSAAAAEGTGKKQQEGRAMATLDRKVPSPEAFLGKPWSSWIDAAKLHCSDNVDLEEAGKEGGKSREVMRLNKEVCTCLATTQHTTTSTSWCAVPVTRSSSRRSSSPTVGRRLPLVVWPRVCLSPRPWVNFSRGSASAPRLTALGAAVLMPKCSALLGH